ncbi:UPF0193 protein EVG1 homolog [Pomacea canaliculata]|uniref:UPF0193 protein EVG1 homolog n=1 Tax=Pomacea canaliculata TaxID=400727 RepID=UPI000D727108|nr:UPF0193 protein EVG1 homolog [Pomacea canaliculata]
MAAPRSSVAQGGFWSTPQVKYSKETHDLLKEMMRESKLTNFQQRQVDRTLKDGGQLPLQLPPTSSIRRAKPPKLVTSSTILNPRNYSGGIRSRETMEAQGAFKKSDYVPPRYNTRSAREKEKLANIMAYGEDVPNIPMERVRKRLESPPPEPDRFDELQQEIEERQKFLSEMESLGRGEKYRNIIATEISQKIREMEIIDKKRSKELEDILKMQNKESQSSGIPHATVMIQ